MKNKTARQMLELIYGKNCMFQRGKVAQRIEELGGILTYKEFVMHKEYKLKRIRKLESTLTYHHLRHRSEGGKTSLENGAVVNELAHQYLHSLPREQEEVVNNLLRAYKRDIIVQGTSIEFGLDSMLEIDGQVVHCTDLIGDDYVSIPLISVKSKEELKNDRKFNRAKAKIEIQQLVDAGLKDYQDEEDDLEKY